MANRGYLDTAQQRQDQGNARPCNFRGAAISCIASAPVDSESLGTVKLRMHFRVMRPSETFRRFRLHDRTTVNARSCSGPDNDPPGRETLNFVHRRPSWMQQGMRTGKYPDSVFTACDPEIDDILCPSTRNVSSEVCKTSDCENTFKTGEEG
jgi:hypothetical protein